MLLILQQKKEISLVPIKQFLPSMLFQNDVKSRFQLLPSFISNSFDLD